MCHPVVTSYLLTTPNPLNSCLLPTSARGPSINPGPQCPLGRISATSGTGGPTNRNLPRPQQPRLRGGQELRKRGCQGALRPTTFFTVCIWNWIVEIHGHWLFSKVSKYRVIHHVDSNLPLTTKEKFCFDLACPDLTWPGQNRTFVLTSMGGLNQRDVSPCTLTRKSSYTHPRLQWHTRDKGKVSL